MASYKLNMARIKGCPAPKEVLTRMEQFGLPDDDEFGIMNFHASETAVFGTIVRRSQQAVQRLDAETKEVTSAPVEKVTLYPMAVAPKMELIELYAGSATGIEQAGAFFSGCLAFATVTEPIELDVVAAVEKLGSQKKFQLVSVRVKDYAANSYMQGPYVPKFLDSQHGMDFFQEYAEAIVSAKVKFAGPKGRVSVNLTPTACFSYSCSNEEDHPTVQQILRKLL